MPYILHKRLNLRLLCGALFVLIGLPASVVGGQDIMSTPEPNQLLTVWSERQSSLIGDRSVQFAQDISWGIDTRRGTYEMTIGTILIGDLYTEDWELEIEDGTINGRALTIEELQKRHKSRRSPLKSSSTNFALSGMMRADLLSMAASASDIIVEDLDGTASLRLELEPTKELKMLTADKFGSRSRSHPEGKDKAKSGTMDRFTVWFSEDGERLLRSRLILSYGDRRSQISVSTLYMDFDGLDVPAMTEGSGTMLQDRRGKTSTAIVSMSSRFSDYTWHTSG